jgi:hypothetical protein
VQFYLGAEFFWYLISDIFRSIELFDIDRINRLVHFLGCRTGLCRQQNNKNNMELPHMQQPLLALDVVSPASHCARPTTASTSRLLARIS